MADRGRDLKFSILSDVSQLNTDVAARGLDKLGDAAKDAGRNLDRLEDDAKGLNLTGLGDDARDAARDVDDAFDTIARASRRSSKAIDDDTDNMKRSLRDVGDEARSSATEAFSSFDGSLDSFADGFSEVAAEAGDLFGPAGLAIGGALAVGANIFYEGYKEKQEQLKELLSDFTDEMIENNGRVSEEFINTKIAALGVDKLREYDQVAKEAAISTADFIRAVSGDPAAIERVTEQLSSQAGEVENVRRNIERFGFSAEADFAAAQGKVREELGLTNEALDGSRSAYLIAKEAIEAAPITPTVDGDPAVSEAARTLASVARTVGTGVSIPLSLDARYALSDADRVAYDIRNRIGTIVVPLRAGQSPYANTANNARYR